MRKKFCPRLNHMAVMNEFGVEWPGQMCVGGKNKVPLHEFHTCWVFWRRQ